MDQLKNLADDRLLNGCIYCGGPEETREHVPSRVFLDPPFPENLPVLPACWECNNGFSRDEEYLACLIECAVAGSTDPGLIRRSRVAEMLRRSVGLRSLIESGKRTQGEQVVFDVDSARVANVVRKLARGHAAYELGLPCRQEPSALRCWPISLMTGEDRDAWEASHVTQLLGEVGSRGVQRQLVTQLTLESQAGTLSTVGLLINDWIDVQDDRYRYLAVDDVGGRLIKIVIGEYLACEIAWADTASSALAGSAE